jgi:hypothetical protein
MAIVAAHQMASRRPKRLSPRKERLLSLIAVYR